MIHRVEKLFKRRTVMQVFTGVDFVAQIDAGFFEAVENRQPALAELGETLLDQTRRTLRPRIDVGPEQGAGKGGVGGESETLAGARGEFQLFDGPFGALTRFAAQCGRGEVVEQAVEGRVHRHQLPLQVRRQLTDDHTCAGADGDQLVAVILTVSGALQIDEASAEGR